MQPFFGGSLFSLHRLHRRFTVYPNFQFQHDLNLKRFPSLFHFALITRYYGFFLLFTPLETMK
jgi:hypothetical protein